MTRRRPEQRSVFVLTIQGRAGRTSIHVDPLAAFIARAEARALLWKVGELSLHESVDALQADAERDGIVAEIGQDRVQALLCAAFHCVARP